MTTAMDTRVELTRAIRKNFDPKYDEFPSQLQIRLSTGKYSDETCALMLTAVGTAHEEVVLLASSSISSDQLVCELVRAMPGHDEYGQVLLQDYFRLLDHYRNVAVNNVRYRSTHLENLVSTADEYLNYTGAQSLPSTTDHEQQLFRLARDHPALVGTLAEHINARGLDQSLLDSFSNHPAPVLSSGVL